MFIIDLNLFRIYFLYRYPSLNKVMLPEKTSKFILNMFKIEKITLFLKTKINVTDKKFELVVLLLVTLIVLLVSNLYFLHCSVTEATELIEGFYDSAVKIEKELRKTAKQDIEDYDNNYGYSILYHLGLYVLVIELLWSVHFRY